MRTRLLDVLKQTGFILGLCGFAMTAHSKPLWTMVPASGNNPNQIVPSNGQSAMEYVVQNQSARASHQLRIMPLPGIRQTQTCSLAPKGKAGSTCILHLDIEGSQLPDNGVHGGPKLCQINSDGSPNPNLCYQPDKANSLSIRIALPSPIQQQISLPGQPFAALTTHDGRYVFVSMVGGNNQDFSGIAVLRQWKTFATVQHLIATCGPAFGLAMTRDGKYLLAAVYPGTSCPSGGVQFINVAKAIAGDVDAAMGTVPTKPSAIEVELSADNTLIFVANEYPKPNNPDHPGTVSVIDFQEALASGQDKSSVIGDIPVDYAAVGLAVSRDNRYLYVTSEQAIPARPFYNANSCQLPSSSSCPVTYSPGPVGTLTVVDINTARTDPANSVVQIIPAGCAPTRALLTNDDKVVWVSARADDKLLTFNTSAILTDPNHALISTTPVGSQPDGAQPFFHRKFMAVANSNRFEGVCSGAQGTVSILDFNKALNGAGAAATVNSFNAGLFPRQWGLSPDGNWLYLTEYLSKTLAIFPVNLLVAEAQ